MSQIELICISVDFSGDIYGEGLVQLWEQLSRFIKFFYRVQRA